MRKIDDYLYVMIIRCIPKYSFNGKQEMIRAYIKMVEIGGVEPPAFYMRSRRAPNCAIPP
jgi:hypothetical protein